MLLRKGDQMKDPRKPWGLSSLKTQTRGLENRRIAHSRKLDALR
jgi:hypothetical protein